MKKTESPVVQNKTVPASKWPFGVVPKATFGQEYKQDARLIVKNAKEALF